MKRLEKLFDSDLHYPVRGIQKSFCAISPMVVAIAALLLFEGCTLPGGGPLKSLDVGPKHAIVIGRVKVQMDGKDITDGCHVTFRTVDPSYEHNLLYGYRLEAGGDIIAQLPLGKYELGQVSHPREDHFFLTYVADVPPGTTRFEVRDSAVLHYIRDVTLTWHKDRRAENTTRNYVLGLLIPWGAPSEIISDGPMSVSIQDGLAETEAHFDALFPDTLTVTNALTATSHSKQTPR